MKSSSWISADHYRSTASLRVQGSEVDFDEISDALGVTPSKVIKKGSLSRIGKVYGIDTWVFDSQLSEDESLEAHIRWFSEKLPSADRIESLRNIRGVEGIDFFCAISPDSTKCRIYLPADLLNMCRKMTCDLEMSFVFGSAQTGRDIDDRLMDVNQGSPQEHFKERSSATLVGGLGPDAQVVLRNALQVSSDGDSVINTLAPGKLELEFDMNLKTAMIEGKSPDEQLLELGKDLCSFVPQLNRLGDSRSFKIESRFETSCEWASTRLSWQAFELPTLLNCPFISEVVLI